MSKKSLSRNFIISEAFHMIDEEGTEVFSMRQLATKLGVQVSSLYNHIDNEQDLLVEVATRTAVMYRDTFLTAVEGLTPEEAVYKGCDVFRAFFTEHQMLYELMLGNRLKGVSGFKKAIDIFTEPIFYYVKLFGVEEQADIEQIYVIARTITHGFSSLELAGAFDEMSFDSFEIYRAMVKSVIDLMKSLAKKNGNE